MPTLSDATNALSLRDKLTALEALSASSSSLDGLTLAAEFIKIVGPSDVRIPGMISQFILYEIDQTRAQIQALGFSL